MAILAVLFVHGIGIGHITITCHGYNACVEKYQSIDEFYLRAEVMRQQCITVLRGNAQSADHSSRLRTSKVAAKLAYTNNGRQLQLYTIP